MWYIHCIRLCVYKPAGTRFELEVQGIKDSSPQRKHPPLWGTSYHGRHAVRIFLIVQSAVGLVVCEVHVH